MAQRRQRSGEGEPGAKEGRRPTRNVGSAALEVARGTAALIGEETGHRRNAGVRARKYAFDGFLKG